MLKGAQSNMKKIIIISVAVLIALSIIVYEGIDYFGQKALNALVDSANSLSVDSETIKKVEEIQIPVEPPKESPEPQKTEEAPNNNTAQQPQEAVKETPKPVKKVVSIEDKAQAINLVKSKFSAGEIAEIQGKVARGLTSQEIIDLKKMVKSRLSAQEIAKIREWYSKYK